MQNVEDEPDFDEEGELSLPPELQALVRRVDKHRTGTGNAYVPPSDDDYKEYQRLICDETDLEKRYIFLLRTYGTFCGNWRKGKKFIIKQLDMLGEHFSEITKGNDADYALDCWMAAHALFPTGSTSKEKYSTKIKAALDSKSMRPSAAMRLSAMLFYSKACQLPLEDKEIFSNEGWQETLDSFMLETGIEDDTRLSLGAMAEDVFECQIYLPSSVLRQFYDQALNKIKTTVLQDESESLAETEESTILDTVTAMACLLPHLGYTPIELQHKALQLQETMLAVQASYIDHVQTADLQVHVAKMLDKDKAPEALVSIFQSSAAFEKKPRLWRIIEKLKDKYPNFTRQTLNEHKKLVESLNDTKINQQFLSYAEDITIDMAHNYKAGAFVSLALLNDLYTQAAECPLDKSDHQIEWLSDIADDDCFEDLVRKWAQQKRTLLTAALEKDQEDVPKQSSEQMLATYNAHRVAAHQQLLDEIDLYKGFCKDTRQHANYIRNLELVPTVEYKNKDTSKRIGTKHLIYTSLDYSLN
jgi:hypothetical protein